MAGIDGENGLLAVAANLSQYHREHEKYYAQAPLADAITRQRTARTLIALAERWTTAVPAAPAASPFAGWRFHPIGTMRAAVGGGENGCSGPATGGFALAGDVTKRPAVGGAAR